MCAAHSVCEDLTRRSVVRSRIAVPLLVPENLYRGKRKDYIFYVNKRLSSPLCVCVCVCVCEAVSGLP